MDDLEKYGDLFGQMISEVRDSTIKNFDSFFRTKYTGEYAAFINDIYSQITNEPKKAIAELLPCIVDEAIIILLQRLDSLNSEGKIDILIKDDGREVSLFDAVEILQSEYLPLDGWVGKFSKERVILRDQ